MEDGCARCRGRRTLDFDFTFAFQPIVDVKAGRVFAFEALVRGPNGEGAAAILERLKPGDIYAFDQAARVKAVNLASVLMADNTALLSINIIPYAVYDPVRCLRTTLTAARDCGFPVNSIMFEITEREQVADVAHLKRIISHYSSEGFITAIDDFGAGFAGLGLLADFKPHIVKLDMGLVRNIDQDNHRRIIVSGVVQTAFALGLKVIAEGIESAAEMQVLRDLGIELFQGFYFAKPALEMLPMPSIAPAERAVIGPQLSAVDVG